MMTMETIKEINPLQIVLVVILVATMAGAFPAVDATEISIVLAGLIGVAKVFDEATTRLVIRELAKIDFGNAKVNQGFDIAAAALPVVNEQDTVPMPPLAKFEAQG